MAARQHERFTVSQWGILIRGEKCLILRSAGKDQWELPGGRIEINELDKVHADECLRREIFEELGISKFDIISLVDRMIGYSANHHSPVCRMVFLIKNEFDNLSLSFEHEELRWITIDEINNYKFNLLINSTPLSLIIKKAFEISRLYEKK